MDGEDSVYIYHGNVLHSDRPEQTIQAPERPSGVGRLFGSHISGPTDVDADGYADLLVSAPEALYPGEGRIYLYRGTAGLLGATPSWRWTGDELHGLLEGDKVTSGLDVNGDGFDDVLMVILRTGVPEALGLSINIYFGGRDIVAHAADQIISGYFGTLSW